MGKVRLAEGLKASEYDHAVSGGLVATVIR